MLPQSVRDARLWIGSATLVIACLVAAACGGSSSSTAGSSSEKASPTPTKATQVSSVDACSLVTASEASAATGATLTNLSSSGGAQIPGACFYGSSGSQSAVIVFAQVYPDSSTADAVAPDQIAAALSGQYGVSNAKAVQGIGDKAFEYTASSSAGGGIAIFVFKANVVLMIIVSPSTDSTKVEGLARTAVGRF